LVSRIGSSIRATTTHTTDRNFLIFNCFERKEKKEKNTLLEAANAEESLLAEIA